MKKIFKYQLDIVDEQYIDLPVGSEAISVVNQHDVVMLYVKVDDEAEATSKVKFLIKGTGHDLDFKEEEYRFLGTVVTLGGMYVWHVFVEK